MYYVCDRIHVAGPGGLHDSSDLDRTGKTVRVEIRVVEGATIFAKQSRYNGHAKVHWQLYPSAFHFVVSPGPGAYYIASDFGYCQMKFAGTASHFSPRRGRSPEGKADAKRGENKRAAKETKKE